VEPEPEGGRLVRNVLIVVGVLVVGVVVASVVVRGRFSEKRS